MAYYNFDREDPEPRTIETALADAPAPCSICGRPEQKYLCWRCGKHVCMNPTNYWDSSTCGGWVLDTWHPGHPEGNEFYCNLCLEAGLVPEAVGVSTEQGISFKYVAPGGELQISLQDGTIKQFSQDETRTLVAYLYDQRGDLFGKPYDPEETPKPVVTPQALEKEAFNLGDF